MVNFVLDPTADIASLKELHAKLSKAVAAPGGRRSVVVEFGSDERPNHLALQLLASAALTPLASGKRLTFGPRAASEIARMNFGESRS